MVGREDSFMPINVNGRNSTRSDDAMKAANLSVALRCIYMTSKICTLSLAGSPVVLLHVLLK